MLQTAFNPLSPKNQYFTSPVLRPLPRNPQAAFFTTTERTIL